MRGARAQEEDLYRRSDMYRHKKIFINKERPYPLATPHRVKAAGMSGPSEGLAMATPDVLIFRDDITTGYEILPLPQHVTVITAVALVKPNIKVGEDCQEAAKQAKCRALILSAFGCGAYENHPREVAEMFYTVLTKYQKDFDTVTFCIKDGIFEYRDRPVSYTHLDAADE